MNNVYLTVIVALVVGVGIRIYDHYHPVQPVAVYTSAKPSEAVKDVQKETIHPSGLKVYGKAANKAIGVSEDKRVISSTKCESDFRDQTVLTTVDPLTGETETSIKREPYKWLQRGKTKELSIWYGLSNRGALWTVTGRMDMFQVFAAHIGVIGSVNSNRDAVAGVEARFLFD